MTNDHYFSISEKMKKADEDDTDDESGPSNDIQKTKAIGT